MTNLHGRAARDFASLSGFKQMVMIPTHIDGVVLDLVLTDFFLCCNSSSRLARWNLRS